MRKSLIFQEYRLKMIIKPEKFILNQHELYSKT